MHTQVTLESFRVMRVFECAFEPSASLTTVVNGVMLVGIMFAFWALFVVYKSGFNFSVLVVVLR